MCLLLKFGSVSEREEEQVIASRDIVAEVWRCETRKLQIEPYSAPLIKYLIFLRDKSWSVLKLSLRTRSLSPLSLSSTLFLATIYRPIHYSKAEVLIGFRDIWPEANYGRKKEPKKKSSQASHDNSSIVLILI